MINTQNVIRGVVTATLVVTAITGTKLLQNNRALANQPHSVLVDSKSKVYFTENFRNYSLRAPGSVDDPGLTLGNDPIWKEQAEINVDLQNSGFVFTESSPLANVSTDSADYDVLFKFRLRDEKQSRLAVHLYSKEGELIIGISPRDIAISSKGITSAVSASAKLPVEIVKNEWHTAAITLRDGNIHVYIDDNRVMKLVAKAAVPEVPVSGVNFYGFEKSPFSVTNIIVRDPAPLPNHTITNILPTPRKDDPANFESGITKTVPANDMFGATIRTGLQENPVTMTLNWNDGKSNVLHFGVAPIIDKRNVQKDGKTVSENFERPDAIIRVTGLNGDKSVLNYHIRPLLRRYKTNRNVTDTYRDIIRDWDLLPKASEHPLKVALRKTDSGVDVYLDSCYAGSIAGTDVRNVVFDVAPTASIGHPFSVTREYNAQKYLPLDVAALGMAKSFVNAKTTINPGLTEVNNIPLLVASGAGSADIGLTRQGQGSWGLEVDEYLARSPFDGLLTEVHFTVPGGVPYTNAWVLCAVDPDAAKDPVLTTRITHYVENGIGGNLIADTTIRLDKTSKDIKRVGTVSQPDANGKTMQIPLYLVKVPLESGKILDQYKNSSMNFEFFGKPWINFEQLDRTIKPDPHSTSAVQVFGATLEKAPVGMDLIQSQPGNIFANNETPETTVVLHSLGPAKGKLVWDIYDVNDKKVKTNSVRYAFSKAGEERKVTLPLQMAQLGWYRLQISTLDQNDKTLYSHRASFALLGEDLRKAKYDSPYATWWFDGSHRTPKEVEFAGPIMFKAGIRKAGWTKRSEADLAQWYITKPQLRMPFKFEDLQDPEKAFAAAKISIQKDLERYPHLDEMMIFHESGPGNDIPMELIGLNPDNQTPEQIAREKRYADLLNMVGPFFREHFPQLKLVVGNTSSSAANIAAILRNGGNPDYIDYIGIESATQVFIPEKLQEWSLQGMHIATDTAKVLSGRDIPATGCYEFTYRAERDMGQHQQAQWYTRDVLISLANEFTTISPGILFDTSNAYYNGLWGGSGMLERAPFGYPKRSYVAYATLTNVLDQVTLRRQVPTGSTTVYAVEFDRADQKFATALWTSRGNADYTISFEGDTTVRVVGMYGNTRHVKTAEGKITVNAGVEPSYIIAEKPIKSITLSNRTFPEDATRARLSKVVAPLDDVAEVNLDNNTNLDTPKTFPLHIPIRQSGDFSLRQVRDGQKGESLEVTLNTTKNPNLSKYVTEYTTVRLKDAAPVQGTPAALGVWVKGNSSWGRVMFEIEDAEGEVWRSMGTGGWGVDILDWPGHLSLNFDGWNFVAVPMRETTLFHDHSPGPVSEQWVSSGGDKEIQYPIKVRALAVEMNRKALNLTDFTTVDPIIRLKDISGIYEKRK